MTLQSMKGYNDKHPEMVLTVKMDAIAKAVAIGDTHCKLRLMKKNEVSE